MSFFSLKQKKFKIIRIEYSKKTILCKNYICVYVKWWYCYWTKYMINVLPRVRGTTIPLTMLPMNGIWIILCVFSTIWSLGSRDVIWLIMRARYWKMISNSFSLGGNVVSTAIKYDQKLIIFCQLIYVSIRN